MTNTNETTTELLDGREGVYGEIVPSFTRIAQVWSGILGTEVSPEQVAMCMAGTKLVRGSNTPDYSDNPDDVDGYVGIWRTIVGDRMINARTVDDYLQQKEARAELELLRDRLRATPAPELRGNQGDVLDGEILG